MNKKILIILLIAIVAFAAVVFIAQKSQKEDITRQQLLQKFQSLKTQYEQAKEQGLDVSEAEKLARDAKQAFDNRDYEKASEFLDKAFTALKKMNGGILCAQKGGECFPASQNCREGYAEAEGYCPGPMKCCRKTLPAANATLLSNVKIALVYERLNDARPKRTMDEQLQIFRGTYTDMIFRASWRWNPQPNSCSEVPSAQKQTCIDSGYSFEDMKNTISEIKKQNPNIIIIGAIPAQKINKNEVNEMTGKTFNQTQTWAMAINPAKWGITSPTKEELQKNLAAFSMYPDGYYPDLTNPEFQELFLSWAKRQIDGGMDGIWIDLLYTQAGKLQGITKDVNHPAVKESYEAASKLVDDIHNYGKSKGKNVYVGSWTAPMYYPYSPPKFDFVTETMGPKEMMDKKYDETKWKNTASKIKEKFGDIPLFVFLDWGFRNSPTEIFSQQMSQADTQDFLGISDDFFTPLGMKFVYPVHGGNMVVTGTPKNQAYGKYNWYDSLAPEFQTYDTIKELAQKKAKGE